MSRWLKGGAWAVATALLLAANLCAQTAGPGCACGAHPPGVPPQRTVEPYAGTPKDLAPFGHFAKPYFQNYTQTNVYAGAGRLVPVPTDVKEVRIGFLGPVAKQEDQPYGLEMLNGAQMAVDEANARGGYGGKPFRLMIHDDYSNWQFGAESGETRPTDAAIWGAPIDAAVKMIYEEKDWAIFGSISSESTHMVLRLALKAEIPIVNSASTDPTVPETYIPWYFTDVQDDRVQAYTLARRMVTELGLKRPALLRVNNRYGRMAAEKFRDAVRRLGRPVVIEQKFLPGQTDFGRELRIIEESRADGIAIWGDQAETAAILKQMRAAGMKQRVLGSYRTLGPEMVAAAGSAAEGFEAVYPYDPSRRDPKWVDFERRYEARFGKPPEQYAALSYDAMNILLESMCRAGLNRARIQDALDQVYAYDGVTGHMVFDPNNKNVSPMYWGRVQDGAIAYRPATMDAAGKTDAEVGDARRPYARVGEGGVEYNGPRRAGIPAVKATVVVMGPGASRNANVSGWPWRVVRIDTGETGSNWGAAVSELVRALQGGDVLAMVALDRDSAHLAEQMSVKQFVPVVALADDRELTSTNIPWIFRLPAKAGEGEALRVLRAAELASGENPEKLRDVLASGRELAGVRFSPAGEPGASQ